MLTTRFSEAGLFCVGCDISVTRISRARNNNEATDGPGFIFHKFTPKSIPKIPYFDVILLLTVIHHWYDSYGWEAAEEMLRETGRKSNKLFFEPPDRKLDRPDLDVEPDSSIEEYYEEYIDTVFQDEIEHTFLGKTSYRDEERSDPLFYIDTSNYGDKR